MKQEKARALIGYGRTPQQHLKFVCKSSNADEKSQPGSESCSCDRSL